MALLVTGGCGFIGGNFVLDWLKESDEQIINLDKLTYAANPATLQTVESSSNYTFVHGDICDGALLADLFAQYKPRAVVHFAAESHVDRSIANPEAFLATNVFGTYELLQASRAFVGGGEASPDFRFLHVSTDEVYGTLEPGDPAFREDTPFRPNSPYAASKASSDHLVRAWHETYGLPVLITNCSNNYGPYQFPEKLIPLVLHRALRAETLPVYGDGQQVRDWLFVGDHCSAIRTVLKSGRPGETYNVGGRNQRTNLEVVHTICSLLDELSPDATGESYARLIRHVADRPGHDRRYAIDATKIERELGWAPAESFASGLRRTVEWYLQNEPWVEAIASGEYLNWIGQNYAGRQ
ncbi:dTDP-glucose 4,6-dehydratase [Terriglobus sp.]|uniref:dTDP-glucose 4,6-dehydratase n=1 Tax=Terriglobus sp. TaxID=1889013 RepID=UPI003B010090